MGVSFSFEKYSGYILYNIPHTTRGLIRIGAFMNDIP